MRCTCFRQIHKFDINCYVFWRLDILQLIVTLKLRLICLEMEMFIVYICIRVDQPVKYMAPKSEHPSILSHIYFFLPRLL